MTSDTGTGDGRALLASKLAVPEAPPFTVDRQRLLDRLTQAVRHPMTVVTGPPGCGKTQLAASWVASGAAPGPVIWITLEDSDNDPAVFWPYLAEGLRRSGVPLSPLIDAAARTGAFDRPLLARLAADLASEPEPIVLVLDSVSVLADRRLAEDLDALLRHAAHHLRMILVGRWDPPLPLYRYRLTGDLGELRGGDLAFTPAEATNLLAGHGVELPDWAIGALLDRTEGWAAGLRLFALAMQGSAHAEELVATIAGDDADIAEYFLGEVLAAQPPEVRDFLLRTSVVDEFTVELAETLIQRGDARHVIAVLERANAFVQPVAARSAVHRFHRLFAELLRAQLAYEQPDLPAELHRRAADWYLANGDIAAATRHAIASQDWPRACTLVVEDLGISRLLAGVDGDRLARSFQEMPAETAGAEANAVLAAEALAATDPEASVRYLSRIRHECPEQSPPLRLTVALLAAVAATMRHDDEGAMIAAATAETMLARVPPDRLAAHPELRAIVRVAKGTAQGRSGALAEAVTTLTDDVGGGEDLRLAGLEQLGLAHAFQGRLRDADAAAAHAAQLAGHRSRTSPRTSVAASAVLAWVATERWNVADAWRHLRAAEAASAGVDDVMTAVAIALVRSRLLSGRGDLPGAVAALAPARPADMPDWLARRIALQAARLDVATGRTDEALAAARVLAPSEPVEASVVGAAALVASGDPGRAIEVVLPVVAVTGLPTPLMIEARLILAVAAGRSGDAGMVRDALEQALALAAADGYRRVFHQAGSWIRHVLRNDGELAAEYQSLTPPADKPIVVDSLSQRELEVLRHLAAMMGTEEIADTMYLSVNTIKTHVRSILRKLAASRRNEAVRRARELGIV
ncbi:LuxR C-terminal-related transcriptional regulator [Actinoplanes solisilvae]|uniref:LuxR C-terminal-related transcriptional regulator n=1 Tax=Actinoplanes solisilvae TaxID=2486853 RepID=UPI000FDB4805|nr:LuxR C-terminal-related transcriptional regulator [Actinoplanes solisilvae]